MGRCGGRDMINYEHSDFSPFTCWVIFHIPLTIKAPPIIYNWRQMQILPLFQKSKIGHDISWESSAGFSCNIISYFCRKLGKMSQNLSSAAVVIGHLRVNVVCTFFWKKNNFFKNIIHEYHQYVRQFRPRSGLTYRQAWSGSKLFVKGYQHSKLPPVGKEIIEF